MICSVPCLSQLWCEKALTVLVNWTQPIHVNLCLSPPTSRLWALVKMSNNKDHPFCDFRVSTENSLQSQNRSFSYLVL